MLNIVFLLVRFSIAIIFLSGCIKQLAVTHTIPVQGEEFTVDVYDRDYAYKGNVIFGDNYDLNSPRIVEVNMQGRVVWEYVLPYSMRQHTNPGFDVERLKNGNILFVLARKGVYEINRAGEIVWSYPTYKVSHDADRLENGNTIMVFGDKDEKSDPQVVEVDKKGNIVWQWYARDHLNVSPYDGLYDQGWTHTNAVTRLENGNTLISLRNFDFIAEVNKDGKVVNKICEQYCRRQHDPELLPNGNYLIANHKRPHNLIEVNPITNELVWESSGYRKKLSPVRDADRLPNGNILVTTVPMIFEMTPNEKVVWRLRVNNPNYRGKEKPARGFYKAQKIN